MPNEFQTNILEEDEVLEGTIEKIVFFNEENHYTVAQFSEDDNPAPITIVGTLANANPGEMYRLRGQWVVDKRFGKQFKVKHFESILPTSCKGIEKYLGSGMIKGIGPAYAKRLVKKFGEQTLDILDNEIDRICEVAGIGRKRLELIKSRWEENKSVREVLINLKEYDISISHGIKIHKMYGTNALKIIRENPYRLAFDIQGIGFKTADKIAGTIGIEKNSPMRAAAGVLHVLGEVVVGEGHTYYPYNELVTCAKNILEIDEHIIKDAIKQMSLDKKIVIEQLPEGQEAVYPKSLHIAETNVALFLLRLMTTGKLFPKFDPAAEISEFEQSHHFTFAKQQQLAILTALQGELTIITGGPGTGKTTIVKGLISILRKKNLKVVLAAPTGRAAKRLTETTGAHAATIHRLLKWDPYEKKFKKNMDDPISADVVIIDEASMLDITLAYHLFKAIPPTTSVVIVGDVDQLPSVGPGNFLKDIINSERIPVVVLNEIFRQAKRSLIVHNAHRINKGESPYLKPPEKDKTTDFYFVERETPEEVLDTIKNLVAERIPLRFKFDPFNDIQVITPMHKGILGAANLNSELQKLLNKNEQGVVYGGTQFKVGDKVMQTKNNYDKDVYNGDIGVIVSIDRIEHIVRINFDGRTIDYDYGDLSEIILAYATTVHKSQGSEFKAVVIPVHTQHFILLQRNLLYTAITRGKRLVIIVGTHKALHIAIKNDKTQLRYSGLYQRLFSYQ